MNRLYAPTHDVVDHIGFLDSIKILPTLWRDPVSIFTLRHTPLTHLDVSRVTFVSVCLNQDISRRILNEEPIMPSYVSTEAIDLMHKLLVKDPTKRLGESLIAFIGPCAYKIYENHSWEKLIEHKSSKEIQHLIGASEIKLQEIAL